MKSNGFSALLVLPHYVMNKSHAGICLVYNEALSQYGVISSFDGLFIASSLGLTGSHFAYGNSPKGTETSPLRTSN